MTNTIDWPAIRHEFEQGVSQHTLAKKYGVSQQAISKRALKEGWVVSPIWEVVDDNPSDNQPLATSAPAIAEQARYIIAKAIQKMKQQGIAIGGITVEYEEYKALKLLMDSLSQAHKIELSSASDAPSESGLPSDLLRFLSADELNQVSGWQANIEAMLETAKERKLEQEQGIKTVHRKIG